MILWCNILVVLVINFQVNAEIFIDNDGGYKNIVVGISPGLKGSEVESLLSQLKTILRSTSEALFTASQSNVFFKEITFSIPKEYKTWISNKHFLNDGTDVKSFKNPDMYVTVDDVFRKPYTIQHRGCGKPGLRINIPINFVQSSSGKKASSLVRQWAHYRYGVFSESGFSNDEVYPACYKIPGSDDIRISDCTNEKAVYEVEKAQARDKSFPSVCTPTPVSGKNNHIESSIMTNMDFPGMNYFCDDVTRPHNRNAPTKQNALCREKNTWEVILDHEDLRIKSKETSNVKPVFKYVVSSDPYFVVAVDTSTEMKKNDRMLLASNAFSYFMYYDVPHDSTVRLVDMKGVDDNVIERKIRNETDAGRLIEMFPEAGEHREVNVYSTIQKLLESLKLDISDIIIITATDITSGWIDNLTTMLKSKKVALHVIYFELKLRHQAFLETVARSSGGNFFYIPEAFPPGSTVSSLTVLYEAFRSIYESFSWMNRKRVLVDQMTFSDDCPQKCTMSFPSDRNLQTLQVVITGIEFGRYPSIQRNSIVLDNGIQQFMSGNSSFKYKADIPAIIITVQNPQTGRWNLTFERKPEFSMPVVAIVRATSGDYGDIINMQSWTTNDYNKNANENSDHPPITVYTEIKKDNSPVIDIEVNASIHQASYNSEWSMQMKDSGDGDPDITKNDGIFSRYLTDIVDSGYYLITVVAEKKSIKYYDSVNGKMKEINCCGSFIPDYLSYDSGYFKRVVTYQSFYVGRENAGKIYPPRRVVDLRIERIEILSNGVKCYILKWTAPGENYDKGRALSYDIKVFKTRKEALDDFHNADVLSIKMMNIQGPLLEPQEAGTTQTAYVELTNLESGTYFVALKTVSHSGKISDVSNVAELTYTQLQPIITGIGFSNGEYYTFPIDSTTEMSVDGEKQTDNSNFNLAIGLTCGILFLLLLIGFLIFVYFERRRRMKKKTDQSSNHNTKKTESSDALCHNSGDRSISIISPVTSWGANSLVTHFETIQRQKTTEVNGVVTVPDNRETDSISLASSKYSYDNKIEQNSSIYDPIYYHQVQSQDELNYPYNPGYTPFDPMYTSSMRRLENSNGIDNPYCSDNASYCSYSLNRSQLPRLKTDV